MTPWSTWFSRLDNQQSIILTGNQRLADFLRLRYAEHRRRHGLSASWAGSRIVPWREWVCGQWQALATERVLLSDLQVQLLWQDCVRQSSFMQPELNVVAMARLAEDAYRLCQEWQIPLSTFPSSLPLETQAFLAWAEAFAARCALNQWLAPVQVLGEVLSALPNRQALLPQAVGWVGIERKTPQLQALIDQLSQQGCEQEWLNSGLDAPASVTVYQASTREHELRQAAEWAKTAAAAGHSVAVIAGDIQVERRMIERVFTEVLGADSYRVSGGDPLAIIPVVQAALVILTLAVAPSVATVRQLLRLPFTRGAVSEADERALLDAVFYEQLSANASVAECYRVQAQTPYAPLWQVLVAAVSAYPLPKTQRLGEWLDHWLAILDATGWPGDTPLSSAEHQAVARFYEVLESVARLQTVQPVLIGASAVALLTTALQQTVFQAQDPGLARVQVLGVLEATGLVFDAIWWGGLVSDAWPRPVQPNPLLPLAFARKLQMPRTSSSGETQYAQQLLTDLRQHCRELCLSYATLDAGLALEPSPLLAPWPVTPTPPLPASINQAALQQPLALDWVADPAPVVSEAERPQLKSGATILKQQAVCPFQAFAKARLKVSDWPKPTHALDAKLRGIILHEVLERVWRDLKAHATLLARLQQDDWQWLDNHISEVLSKWHTTLPERLTPVLQTLEQIRLNKLVRRWLALEAEREPFTVVASEQALFAHWQGIPLHVRLDRVDQLATGERLIIDYKTGQVDAASWYQERLTEPQLPLYAVLSQAEGIAFAELRPEALKFKGVTARPGVLPGVEGVKPSLPLQAERWEVLIAHWQQALTTLAQAFLQGDARVDPVSPQEACQRCDLQRLCRIGRS